MPRRKTDEEFKQEVYNLVKDEYTFLEPYVNGATRLSVKHNKCGNIYKVTPSNFLGGSRCPKCSQKQRNQKLSKTDRQFKQEVYNLVGDSYTVLDNYVNNYTKLKIKHNRCGNVYEVMPNSFLEGHGCPYCAGLAKKTDKKFKQEVYNLVGNSYTVLDNYVNANTKLKIKHNKCGNVYEVRPYNFLNGRRCPKCLQKQRVRKLSKTDKQFKQEVYSLVGNSYTVLDNYVNNYTKLKVKHNKCGNIYKVTPYCFLDGIRCPYCNSPKGELIIDKILKSLNISYEPQKTFDDLKDKSYLSYDFYIPDQNILLEYQGIQHYKPIGYFGGEDTFKKQQKHDKMKLDYAKEHGYNLIAVPYTEDTLSKIKKYLIKHGLNYKEKLWEY